VFDDGAAGRDQRCVTPHCYKSRVSQTQILAHSRQRSNTKGTPSNLQLTTLTFDSSCRQTCMMFVAGSASRLQQTSSVLLTHQHQVLNYPHHVCQYGGTWRKMVHSLPRNRMHPAKLTLQNSTTGGKHSLNKNLYRRRWMTTNMGVSSTLRVVIWKEISTRPIEFLSIPCVAAFVGILTNWMGVKVILFNCCR
jgi:hypothetical protein